LTVFFLTAFFVFLDDAVLAVDFTPGNISPSSRPPGGRGTVALDGRPMSQSPRRASMYGTVRTRIFTSLNSVHVVT
jgi:hypothetical protein